MLTRMALPVGPQALTTWRGIWTARTLAGQAGLKDKTRGCWVRYTLARRMRFRSWERAFLGL